mgnify:CR=1 FL=1
MSREMAESGAGLRNVQHRIELIGGTSHVRSSPGEGTEVQTQVNRS